MAKMIVTGTKAMIKAMSTGQNFDVQTRYIEASEPMGERRIVSSYVLPGENAPFAVIEIIDRDVFRWNGTVLAMFLPTLEERQKAAVAAAQQFREMTEIVIDGKSTTFVELFGVAIP